MAGRLGKESGTQPTTHTHTHTKKVGFQVLSFHTSEPRFKGSPKHGTVYQMRKKRTPGVLIWGIRKKASTGLREWEKSLRLVGGYFFPFSHSLVPRQFCDIAV